LISKPISEWSNKGKKLAALIFGIALGVVMAIFLRLLGNGILSAELEITLTAV
jgi:hypothetical protein